MNSKVINKNFKTTGDKEIDSGREPVQCGWYEFASDFCKNKTVLDVGCGMGEGIKILEKSAKTVNGIDLDERLIKRNVKIMEISEVPSDFVDIVTCIDVLEHVEEDCKFIGELFRVARKEILLSTPNYTISRCLWPYHVREYMPHELASLFNSYGKVEMYKGSLDGYFHYKIKYFWPYSILNILRVNPITGFTVRIINHILPIAFRIQPSLFIRIKLNKPITKSPSSPIG